MTPICAVNQLEEKPHIRGTYTQLKVGSYYYFVCDSTGLLTLRLPD